MFIWHQDQPVWLGNSDAIGSFFVTKPAVQLFYPHTVLLYVKSPLKSQLFLSENCDQDRIVVLFLTAICRDLNHGRLLTNPTNSKTLKKLV
jgi:hypothetical protein